MKLLHFKSVENIFGIIIILLILLVPLIIAIKSFRSQTFMSELKTELNSCGDVLEIYQSLYSKSGNSQLTLLPDGLLLMSNGGYHEWLWRNNHKSKNKLSSMMISFAPGKFRDQYGIFGFVDDHNAVLETIAAYVPNLSMVYENWALTILDGNGDKPSLFAIGKGHNC